MTMSDPETWKCLLTGMALGWFACLAMVLLLAPWRSR